MKHHHPSAAEDAAAVRCGAQGHRRWRRGHTLRWPTRPPCLRVTRLENGVARSTQTRAGSTASAEMTATRRRLSSDTRPGTSLNITPFSDISNVSVGLRTNEKCMPARTQHCRFLVVCTACASSLQECRPDTCQQVWVTFGWGRSEPGLRGIACSGWKEAVVLIAFEGLFEKLI